MILEIIFQYFFQGLFCFNSINSTKMKTGRITLMKLGSLITYYEQLLDEISKMSFFDAYECLKQNKANYGCCFVASDLFKLNIAEFELSCRDYYWFETPNDIFFSKYLRQDPLHDLITVTYRRITKLKNFYKQFSWCNDFSINCRTILITQTI